MRIVTLLGLASVALTSAVLGQAGHGAQAPAAPAINWGPAPANLPPGAKLAVLQGDPSQDAMFTIRLDLPNGYTFAPHFHPTDEHVTIIQGTLLLGMGDQADFTHPIVLPTGGFITAAANQHHFARAKGRTIVQIHAMGPFALTWVNPADDPQRKAGSQ